MVIFWLNVLNFFFFLVKRVIIYLCNFCFGIIIIHTLGYFNTNIFIFFLKKKTFINIGVLNVY